MYGQNEVLRDLIDAPRATTLPLYFDRACLVEAIVLSPSIRFP